MEKKTIIVTRAETFYVSYEVFAEDRVEAVTAILNGEAALCKQVRSKFFGANEEEGLPVEHFNRKERKKLEKLTGESFGYGHIQSIVDVEEKNSDS